MKWWYVVVLILGVGIGWWILKNYGMKKETPMMVIEESQIKEITKLLPTQVTTDNKGVKQQTVEVVGAVQSWFPETGIIVFVIEGKEWRLNLDPSRAIIFVPSLADKSREIMIKDTNNIHWRSAFCKGDMVVIRLANDKVIFVSNGGYRSCGFKGE